MSYGRTGAQKRTGLFVFNSLISRRLKSHNQAAEYHSIPSWYIPEYREKNSETRNTVQVYVAAATFRVPHIIYPFNE